MQRDGGVGGGGVSLLTCTQLKWQQVKTCLFIICRAGDMRIMKNAPKCVQSHGDIIQCGIVLSVKDRQEDSQSSHSKVTDNLETKKA